jgi:hypothetical protein
MISKQKKFLFIHIPKTAGNSLTEILSKYSEDKLKIVEYENGVPKFNRVGVNNEEYKTNKHSPPLTYKRGMPQEIFDSLYKFSVIRNPWDRVISFYFSPHFNNKRIWNRDSFLKLINSVHVAEKYICLKKNPEKLDEDINKILQFEKINEELKVLCEMLNIPYTPLPKNNTSNHEHYSKYLDDELREMISRKYKLEVEYFNYTF